MFCAYVHLEYPSVCRSALLLFCTCKVYELEFTESDICSFSSSDAGVRAVSTLQCRFVHA